MAVRSDDEPCGMAATVGSVTKADRLIWLALRSRVWAGAEGRMPPLRVGYGRVWTIHGRAVKISSLRLLSTRNKGEKEKDKRRCCRVRFCQSVCAWVNLPIAILSGTFLCFLWLSWSGFVLSAHEDMQMF